MRHQSSASPSIDGSSTSLRAGLAAGLVESFMEQVGAYAALRAQIGSPGPGWRWSSGQEICLAEGGPSADGTPTLVAEPLGLPQGLRGGAPKSCWANAWALARSSSRRGEDDVLRPGRFVYVEGYAASLLPSGSALAVSHAWCLDRHTMQIVDPTWGGEAVTFRAEAQVYLGLAFSLAFMEQAIIEANPDAGDGSVRGRDLHISLFESDHRRAGRVLRLGFEYDVEPDHDCPGGDAGGCLPLVVGWGADVTPPASSPGQA